MEPAEAPELSRGRWAWRGICASSGEAPPPRKLSISRIVLTTQRRFPCFSGCSARSPCSSCLHPRGPQGPCEIRTSPCCWQDRRGLLWLQAAAAATTVGNLVASPVPRFPHLQSVERLGAAGQGLQEGQWEPGWVPVGCQHCSLPHRCLLGGHRRLYLPPQGTGSGPNLISVQRCRKPPALPTEEEAMPGAGEDGAGERGAPPPPDTGNAPAAALTAEMRLRTDFPAFTTLHVGFGPKRGPQPCTPLPSPRPPSRTSPSASVSLARWRAPAAPRRWSGEAGWGSSRPPHRSGRPPAAPSPARPLELLNHVLGSGGRSPGLPAASTRDPLLPAADGSRETQPGERRPPVLPSPASASPASRERRASSWGKRGSGQPHEALSRDGVCCWRGQPGHRSHGTGVQAHVAPRSRRHPGDMHPKPRPRLKHPRDALAEGAGGGFS